MGVYQLLAHGRWFSLDTPASSITKTARHDIAEILLKVALKHQKSNHIEFPYGIIQLFDESDKSKLRVECALFVIYKAGREPTPYW
jgi:hypothetical protein